MKNYTKNGALKPRFKINPAPFQHQYWCWKGAG